jgi:16S rRNA (guanine527-N7)-methyltransferase
MGRLFAEHGVAVRPEELERYWRYYELLKQHNRHLELTRIIGIEATVLKHFIDCLLVADMVELRGPVLDIGSGPGFPGAPIAIRRPELPVILAESRGKRVRFLESLVRELGLENATVHGRSVTAESDLAAGSVVTRALEVIPATLARVKDLVPPGGLCVLMKGPNCGQEITDAQETFRGVWTMREDHRYTLPETSQHRRLVVFERRDEAASET